MTSTPCPPYPPGRRACGPWQRRRPARWRAGGAELPEQRYLDALIAYARVKEHGAIWVTYDPAALSDATVTNYRAFVDWQRKNGEAVLSAFDEVLVMFKEDISQQLGASRLPVPRWSSSADRTATSRRPRIQGRSRRPPESAR